MFQLQVTIIKWTFQYMNMTCSVPKHKQCGIPYCGTKHIMSMY